MTQYVMDPAIWGLVVGAPAAATIIVRQQKAIRKLRKRNDELKSSYVDLEGGYDAIVRQTEERAGEETKTVLKSAMRTLQGLAAEQQLVISKLQSKYGDSPILRDLLEIDHMNSQFGRRAQSIAVLCQGWLGRQRDPASVYDVIRSAQGRIRHYQRVEILSQVDYGVTSRAVESIALAVAELLDNATSYSAPETVVEINVRSVPKGICIVVDDAGVGMNEEEKARAAELLSGERAASVSDLGNPPQFGFAVIGALCERYGFTVSVDSTSPYGGVRAVVLVPEELLTSMPEPKIPNAAVNADAQADEAGGDAPATTSDGLPKRRRKQRPMAVVPSTPGTARSPGRSTEETASIMSAFQRGTQTGRAAPLDAMRGSHADGRKGPETTS
ncbi:ATP-binding protein [Streptomyces chartreusis]|uniref:ATP-binding protein n=1 Tax=Streptomyces chartreusis TaxID=1969 RepID=UPI00366778FB